MGIDQAECGRAAVRAADLVLSVDHLVDVVVNARVAEALATLVTLTRLYHDILAKDTIKQTVVRGVIISDCGLCDLTLCQRHQPLHDERTGARSAVGLSWDKFGHFLSVFIDRVML